MPEIFGRVPLAFGGGFAADAANIFFGMNVPVFNIPVPVAGVGLLTQNIGINYQQPVTRIYEIGGNKEYYVAGRPQGNMSIGRIVGPRPVTVSFYTTFGNVCLGPLFSLLFAGAAGCDNAARPELGGANGFMFMMNGAVLQGIGISVAAQDMIINEQLSFMFISLLVPGPGGQF